MLCSPTHPLRISHANANWRLLLIFSMQQTIFEKSQNGTNVEYVECQYQILSFSFPNFFCTSKWIFQYILVSMNEFRIPCLRKPEVIYHSPVFKDIPISWNKWDILYKWNLPIFLFSYLLQSALYWILVSFNLTVQSVNVGEKLRLEVQNVSLA